MSESQTESHEFQAEVKQVLDIVVHSLYTDKEVFLRELVSNASDACEKLRHLQLTEKEIFDDNLPLEIQISTDDQAGTITIQDFGVGLTRDELVQNLGRIAYSGSKEFLKALQKGGDRNENLIGQFGVGFYSAFMVAKEVRVYTHSWRTGGESLVWRSGGGGTYEIETSEGQRRGAKIVLYLEDEWKEFSQESRVKGILERYSSFLSFPLTLNGNKVNTIGALWTKPKDEISEEEHKNFYQFQAAASDEPRFWMHFSADAPLAIQSLLYVPQQNTERFGFGRMEPGVALYCRKILIDRKPDGILPEWLRFLRGVVDSADLPLNISRESMQDSGLIQKLSRVLTKRFLKTVEEKSRKDPESFDQFYDEFHGFLKEGVVADATHREQLAPLLRFESSLTEAGKRTSLSDYLSRAKEEQKEIYTLSGKSRKAIEGGPYLEAFTARGLEVLFLIDPIDEFVINHLGSFKEKRFVSGDSDEVKFEDRLGTGEPLSEKETEQLLTFFKETLGERASAVETGNRLDASPIALLNTDRFMTAQMRQLLKSMKSEGAPEGELPVRVEVNPRHPLIHRVNQYLVADDKETAAELVFYLFDGAKLAAGLLDDATAFVSRGFKLLEGIKSPANG